MWFIIIIQILLQRILPFSPTLLFFLNFFNKFSQSFNAFLFKFPLDSFLKSRLNFHYSMTEILQKEYTYINTLITPFYLVSSDFPSSLRKQKPTLLSHHAYHTSNIHHSMTHLCILICLFHAFDRHDSHHHSANPKAMKKPLFLTFYLSSNPLCTPFHL